MYDPKLYSSLQRIAKSWTQKSDPDFLQPFLYRFHANVFRIKSLFDRLYGSRHDAHEQFEMLLEDLFETFQERPARLRQQDLDRIASTPNWLLSEKRVGMMLYVDRFAEDLKGFQQKIDYLEELGVNWVHLMPVLKSPKGSNDGGYAVSDYRDVDEKFGTLRDLKDVADILQQKNILLTLDVVMNHTSDQHEWAQKAKEGDSTYQNYYYFYPDRSVPDQFEESMPEVFPHSAPGNFTFIEEVNQWVMTVFHQYQWDLNYRNPAVFREMLKVLFYLANLGVDILRLDAVAFTWKEIGTRSQNLEEAHIILQLMKACSQVLAPGVAFIAEAIVAPKEVVRYFGEGDGWGRECEIAYHATGMALLWEALATGEVSLLNMGLRGMPTKPAGTTWIKYLRCHDDIGLGFDENHIYALGKEPFSHKRYLVDYYVGKFPGSTATGAPFAANPKTGDARISGSMAALVGLEHAVNAADPLKIDLAIRKIDMLHSIILSYGGLPMLYYGDEIGTINHYAYLNDPDQAYDNRWLHRPIMDWEKAEKRHQKGTVEQRIFSHLKKLIRLRKASPEMADHNSVSVEEAGNKHVFTFLRWNNEGARTIVICNFSDETRFLSFEVLYRCGFDPLQLMDKISGKEPLYHHDLIELGPYAAYWLTDESTFEAFQAAEEIGVLREEGLWPK